MKKLLTAIRRAPKLSGLVAVLTGAVLVPAALLAWGPDRPTYTIEKPAPHVTFNSITNNPKHGDERNFVQIRNYTDNAEFSENTELVPGKEYEVYVYYHNNASPDLNSAANNYKGIALNTRMKVQMPATVAAGQNARVTGTVSADNAKPVSVWDEAYGKNATNGTVALRYVPNSAKVASEGAVNGQSLDINQLASANGALLGYDKLDGKVPGCMKYTGYVTYRFKVDQPNFEVSKQVSETKKNAWTDSVSANAGDIVDFRIHYKNTGTVTQENVRVRDDMPKGLSLVEGSARYYSSKTNGAWQPISDVNALTTTGVNFGSFSGNGGALYVAFQARVTDENGLECGVNKLINRAVVTTDNGTKTDTASVVVEKECKDEPKPEMVKVCDLRDKTVREITKEEYEADTNRYTTDLTKCDEVVEEGHVKVCNPETGEIITVKESEKGKYLPVDSVECKEKEAPIVTELPKTGVAGGLSGLLGLGALTTASYYYVTSRRQ